jgi:ribosomal protein S18 acetylase RimI-like enzyme
MEVPMNIRLARESDLLEIMRLLHQINSEHHAHAPAIFASPETNKSDHWIRQILDPERLFLVAESSEKIIGMITAMTTANSNIPFLSHHKVCRIGTIVVDVQHRRSGTGRLLMAKAEAWAADTGANEIRLEVMEFNQRALSFYVNDGYETQSRIMSKRIA